jgi:UDP-galactopyranose mutase
VRETHEGVLVARPYLIPRPEALVPDAEIDKKNGEALVRLLKKELADRNWQNLIHWFYTPMAYWLADEIPSTGCVYDCMDELSLFKNPPPGILECEVELLNCADLVFTGGRSLYLGKVERHPQVHMFASGVEVEHFAKAFSTETTVPAEMEAIGRPRFTYTGVIDERLNLQLVDDAARLRPDWQIVMIGPVVKISEADLPHRPNIHYLGQKPYADLPAYLKGTDVAIMPFALNDSTKFLSPTKTLEYMAARRPVIGTGIADVEAYYSQIVWIVKDGDDFVRAGEDALKAKPERLDEGLEMAKAQTWDSIVERMDTLLNECLDSRDKCRS